MTADAALRAAREEARHERRRANDAEARVRALEARVGERAEALAAVEAETATLGEEAAAARLDGDRLRVALDRGLPAPLADRLRGASRAELELDADRLTGLVARLSGAADVTTTTTEKR